MRRRRCCDACRRRHRRCIVGERETRCTACIEAVLDCHFDTAVRFKHARQEVVEAPAPRANLPTAISFVKPLGLSANDELDRDKNSPRQNESTSPKESGASPVTAPLQSQVETNYGGPGFIQQSQTPSDPTIASPAAGRGTRRDEEEAAQLGPTSTASLNIVSIPYILGDSASPAGPDSFQLSPPAPVTHQIAQAHSFVEPSVTNDAPLLSKREAFLFRTYIEKLAPSSDGCDEARHFTLEVPCLAFREPMILNGVLALASRYEARRTDSSDLECTYYHNRSIESIIDAFSKPPDTWDSALLTAVVFARLYEEYENETDSHFHHLSGTWNLLNHEAVARFVMQGGLAEAASFVHLRQAIYVHLVPKSSGRQPVDINLASFEQSTSFRKHDASAFANRSVYLLAKTLRLFLPVEREDHSHVQSPGSDMTTTSWDTLEMEVDAWMEQKPLSFRPIHYEAADPNNGKPFPDIWMAASVPVVGMQHYYATRIILCLHRCTAIDPSLGFRAFRRRRNAEKEIAAYLGILMALPLSNREAINAFYLPCHMLSLCGYCIQHPCERTHTIEYLRQVQEILQWNTKTLITTLEKQWEEVDESG